MPSIWEAMAIERIIGKLQTLKSEHSHAPACAKGEDPTERLHNNELYVTFGPCLAGQL
jgi:pyrimidine deaminase RibD-like protein